MAPPRAGRKVPELVMIGVSAGGMDAVSLILQGLPERFSFAIVVVQHRATSSDALCDILQRHTTAPVTEVVDKEPIQPGHIYIAPPDYHLLIEAGYFALSVDAPELYSRPSIDLAFESAADAYRERAVGVVLTGANGDGSRGLSRIVERGGHAVVQDPATAQVPVMPAAALAAVPDADVVPLENMARYLGALSSAPDSLGAKSA